MGTVKNISDEIEQLVQPYNFETIYLKPILEKYWAASFPIALIYLLSIVVGRNYMKARKGFNLQRPLILWSFCLAIFSTLGAVRMWYFMGSLAYRYSLKQSVCYSSFSKSSVLNFWSCIFVFSKIIEFGDTAFIILRKQTLNFVHWYHHSTVLMFTSFAFKNKMGIGGWFMTMNLGVHAIMYTYYTLKAAKVKSPMWFPRLVTSVQILQMVMGINFIILAYIWGQEQECQITKDQIFWSFILYGTYFILFAHFFYQAYIVPTVKAKAKSR